jgi:hypothetical protein
VSVGREVLPAEVRSSPSRAAEPPFDRAWYQRVRRREGRMSDTPTFRFDYATKPNSTSYSAAISTKRRAPRRKGPR